MKYVVGIDVGSTLTTVSISDAKNPARRTAGRFDEVLRIPSVVLVRDDHALLVGEDAVIAGHAEPERVITFFKERVGDSVPLIVNDWSASAEAVVAEMIRWTLARVVAERQQQPEAVAVTYPAIWGKYKQSLLSSALTDAGLAHAILASEPVAAAIGAAGTLEGAHPKVAVFDLGGEDFTATVVEKSGNNQFLIKGEPQQLAGIGGGEFDEVIFSKVLACAGSIYPDKGGDWLRGPVGRLRRTCRAAKESLSVDTDVTVSVGLPPARKSVRVTRSEFEEWIHDDVERILEVGGHAIAGAGLTPAELDAIVLVGGSSRIPLVAQMVSATFDRPIIVATDPGAEVSMGAAWLAATSGGPMPPAGPVGEISPGADHPDRLSDDELIEPVGAAGGSTAPPGANSRRMAAPRKVARHRTQHRRHWGRGTVVTVGIFGLMLAGGSLTVVESSAVPGSSVGQTGDLDAGVAIRPTEGNGTPAISTVVADSQPPGRPVATDIEDAAVSAMTDPTGLPVAGLRPQS